MSEARTTPLSTIVREWASVAALIPIIYFLSAIYKQADTNCDAIAATNASIRFTLAVSAEKARGEERQGLREQVRNFPEPEC